MLRASAENPGLAGRPYFVGLTLEEIATLLGISPRTADRDLASAKAWLGKEIIRLR